MLRDPRKKSWIGPLLGAACCAASALVLADEELDPASQKVAPTAFNNPPPQPVLDWGEGDGRSYWIPAADIVGFQVLLNLFDRMVLEGDDFDANPSTAWHNLTGSWVYDSDPYDINQFGHPYQGSLYHGFARSAGQGYWTSMGYTVLGSALWEIAGEKTPPSINDQITTGFGGTFLGEPLFRLASLMLESGNGRPGFWRSFGAALISPATGFNRYAYGDRFDGVFRSNNPAVQTSAQLGVNLNATVDSNVNLNPNAEQELIPQSYKNGEATLDFNVAYGLPGKPGYAYKRPFDYFNFQLSFATGSTVENIMTRGLLYGASYAYGDHYRGVWGLYGMYDYIAPQIFRVSSTAIGLGTTGQWWLSEKTALQGTALAGVGYGSAGITRNRRGDRDYHNGITPQGLLAMRLIFSDRAAFDMTAREYYVSDVASDEPGGTENISRGDASIVVRVKGVHGIGIKYVMTHREARYSEPADTRQTVGAVALAYTYLGHTRFGAVDWRPDAALKP
jgi:hypothetical protein